MAVWQQSMPQFPAATPTEQQIKSWLISLNSALDYAFHNLDSENMTGAALAVVKGSAGGAKEVPITEADKRRLDELRAQLRRDILAKATEITHDYQSAIEQTDQAIRSEVSEGYIAKSGDVDAGNAAELLELMQSQITQTSDAWTARFTQLSSAVDQTQTDLGNLSDETAQELGNLSTGLGNLSSETNAALESTQQEMGSLREQTQAGLAAAGQQITENHNEFNQYVELTETYIRLTARGIEIGMLENNEQAPYSVLLGNEKLSFFQYGVEVAYFQYNKLYVTSAEFLDRFSVGSAANGGFFEFVTTPQGLGIKWRDA